MDEHPKRYVENVSCPIRIIPRNVMFLQQSGANGTLPDGRKFDIGSTCGLGGVSLIISVYGKTKDGHDSPSFEINAREAMDLLCRAGAFDLEAPDDGCRMADSVTSQPFGPPAKDGQR
jgi:hypothetical protein